MRALVRELMTIGRLEGAEVLRSRWLLVCAAVYGALAAIFVLVGLRESTVLGFTGTGRVLLSFCHALLLVLPLLGLSATTQVIPRARDDGTLELLLTQPLSRGAYFLALALVRYLALLLPLLALLLGLGLLGRVAFGQAVPWGLLGGASFVSAALLLAAVGLGLCISALVRHQARAALYGLLAWALGIALLDFALIGLMLRFRLHAPTVFLLSALNPVQAARVALLSGVEPELGVLGPVGFFLAQRLGSGLLLLIGIMWPLCFGAACLMIGRRRFTRGDVL